MTLPKFSLIIITALMSPAGMAQFASSGGMGGVGGMGGTNRMGGMGGRGSAPTSGKMNWRPWVNVGGFYIDNAPYFDSDGNLQTTTDTRGASAGWGVMAGKAAENTELVASYSGGAVVRAHGDGIQGTSHVFSLIASHRFNRNLFGSIQQLIGSSLGGYGVGSGFIGTGGLFGAGSNQPIPPGGMLGFGNPGLNGLVDEEPFSNRVNYFTTGAGIGYRLTMRSSISFNGAVNFIRRRQAKLADSDGYSGSANYNYALDRNTVIGAGYSWGTYKYPARFGNNVVQTAVVGMSRQLGPRAGVSGLAGLGYFNSAFIGTVTVDPQLAELLGVTSSTSVQEARRLTFTGGITAYYSADIANFSVTAQRGMVPGNGLYYASVRDVVAISMGRRFFDRLSGTLTGSLSRMSGLLQQDLQTRYQAGVSLGYRLGLGLSLTAGGGLRWQRIAQNGPYLPQKVANVGIGWSPGDQPFFF